LYFKLKKGKKNYAVNKNYAQKVFFHISIFFIFDYVPVKLVFWFLQGLVNLQDGILPLLMNNSLKMVFKRSVKVSSWHISL